METFRNAANPLEGFDQAIAEHLRHYPDAKIRDSESALKHANAIFVSQGATRLEEFGTDIPNGRYHIGISCGDGSEAFFIDVGFSQDRGNQMARQLCWYNADLKILSERPPQPFIAVNPHRIGKVHDHRGNMIFNIKDQPHAFSVVYADDHRASIDSFLLENRLIQARFGNVRLDRPKAVGSGDNDNKVVALPFRTAKLI